MPDDHPVPAELPEPPDDSLVGTPPRRPGSVRRTAHINMVWPDGRGTQLQLRGRARDLLTTADRRPVVLAEARMVVGVGPERTIESVEVHPPRPGAEGLVGARGGDRMRSVIDEAIPGERESATPLHFLLDDVAGASLIAGFAWSQSHPDEFRSQPRPAAQVRLLRRGRIICSGLRPGGYAELKRERGDNLSHYLRRAGDIETPDDSWGWHEIEPAPAVCLRRRRRVDVWRENGELAVDAHFRDSLWDATGTELALHEYSLEVGLDPAHHTVTRIAARPRVLPFPECPWAASHVSTLVGRRVDGFRTGVQETLTELECCTHLNDMLRCLAEVGHLASAL